MITFLKAHPKFLIISLVFNFIFAQHFNVAIDETGESTLFIFESSISSLNVGDELGVFDSNGVVDDQGNSGEILVGAGIWTGSQLEITAITAVDLSQFGGPILPGAVSGNTMSLKVWKTDELLEYDAAYSTSSGSYPPFLTCSSLILRRSSLKECILIVSYAIVFIIAGNFLSTTSGITDCGVLIIA